MTLGATYYVLGVTLVAVGFPWMVYAVWSRIGAGVEAALAPKPQTHCAGAPHSA